MLGIFRFFFKINYFFDFILIMLFSKRPKNSDRSSQSFSYVSSVFSLLLKLVVYSRDRLLKWPNMAKVTIIGELNEFFWFSLDNEVEHNHSASNF